LLFDEPLAALDPIIRARLQDDLRRIFRELGKTVVFVTHDLGEAAFVADEIALLNDGRIVQKGALDELLRHPKDAFVTEFLQAQRAHFSTHGEAR
jgi:osmoprotectant transport system ATP-binding protein